MNRAKFVYEALIGTTTLLGGVVGSSTFAYESRHDGPISVCGAAVFGGAVGVLGGFIAGASSPVVIPGLLIATAVSQSEAGSKKLIDGGNSFLAGKTRNGIQAGQAPTPGSPSAPVSI